MKTLPTAIITTAVVGLSIFEVSPSLAASFNFSYDFVNGDKLYGMLEGDLQADGDTVTNLSNVMATFEEGGSSTVVSSLDTGFGTVSFSGNNVNFILSGGDTSSQTFVALLPILTLSYSSTGLTPFNIEGFDVSRWSFTEKTSVRGQAATPEPLTLLGAGTAAAFGVSFKRKLAHKKSNKTV